MENFTYYGTAKRWWHSITIWFGTLLMVAGVAVEYINTESNILAPYFGKWGGAVTVGIGVLNVVLRMRTTLPIATKQ